MFVQNDQHVFQSEIKNVKSVLDAYVVICAVCYLIHVKFSISY